MQKMKTARRNVAILILLLNGTALLGQETPAPTPSAEPTLPPVVVRPSDEPANPYSDGEGMGYFGSGGSGRTGAINWDSAAVTSDTQRVGAYNQPAWTTQRPFASTRTYVLPAGTYEFEQWVRPTWNRDDPTEWRFLEEIALGLGCRWQLDIYERWNIEPDDDNKEQVNHEGVQIEARYALADWDVIPLNPTLYAEWIERGGPQDDKPNKFEIKLLLSDELFHDLYYASNIVLEQEVAGELETEIAWSNAFGTTIIDRLLMAGIEMNLSSTTVEGARGEPETAFTIGPSIQLRPTNRTFWDVVALFGTTEESPICQMYIVWGYQFGTRAGPSNGYAGGTASSYFQGNGNIQAPTSTRGN
jgi:hypothetical protein